MLLNRLIATLQAWKVPLKKCVQWLMKPYVAYKAYVDRKLPSWRQEIVLGIVLAGVSLLLNAVYLGVSLRRNHPGPNGLGVFDTGTCRDINLWNQFYHGVINVASTLLLQQSNTVMQIIASPYRHEVDRAHKKRDWLDIGTTSMRNVWKRSIAPERIVTWWLIAISSLPLHLLWNSILVSSPRAFAYLQLAVDERFIWNTTSFDATLDTPGLWGSPIEFAAAVAGLYPDNLDIVQASVNDTDVWERLDVGQCARAYMQTFLRDRSDVIVVTNVTTALHNRPSILGAAAAGFGYWPYEWLCADLPVSFECRTSILRNNDQLTLDLLGLSLEPEYCLSKKTNDVCTLEYAWIITIFVICANAFKLTCFLYSYYLLHKAEAQRDKEGFRLLLTNEDAIASFLEHEDRETSGMCLAGKKDFESGLLSFLGVWFEIQPRKWHQRYAKSWFRAVGKWRWFALMVLMFAIFFVPTVFLLLSIPYYRTLGVSGSWLLEFGIGNPVGQFLIGGLKSAKLDSKSTTIRDMIVANLPQLLLSIAQFWWTSQMTTMVATREYDKFASTGRKLRISYQEGSGTIGLSWRYRWFNFGLWTLIPWLASQAVFFAKIDMVNHWLYPTSNSISQVGYSVLGLTLFAVFSFVAFVIGLMFGLRRLPNCTPLAGTCSAAISAACHPTNSDMKHHEREIRWGVEKEVTMRDDEIVYRCTFTSSDGVEEPSEFDEMGRRRFYA